METCITSLLDKFGEKASVASAAWSSIQLTNLNNWCVNAHMYTSHVQRTFSRTKERQNEKQNCWVNFPIQRILFYSEASTVRLQQYIAFREGAEL